jgi:hypothetical protein
MGPLWKRRVLIGVIGLGLMLVGGCTTGIGLVAWHLWGDHTLFHQLLALEVQRQQEVRRTKELPPKEENVARPEGVK